ncbi:MAG TPA: DNA recombination protein RmuC, partial [Paracoccaceae bacterium]|nr:DNA recombination protein RmuC [Paracoccaceae bacterium]
MIRLGETEIALTEPLLLAGAAVLVILLLILWAALRAGRVSDPLLRELGWLSHRVQGLAEGQERLSGALLQVSETQAQAQAATLQLMEARLAEVSRGMTESLQGTSLRTARSLGDLHQRLETIDRA